MTTNDDAVEMEIFRCGDYGPKGSYTEADLDAIASDYAPERHEAPLTVDHAQSGPALGWISGVRRTGDRLVAMVRGIPDSIRQALRSGALKKRSIELVRRLPATGRPYLRAVTLLGAAVPEVKGLRDVCFSENEGEVIRMDDAGDGATTEIAALRSEIARLRAEAFARETDALFAESGVGERDRAVLRQLIDRRSDDQVVRFGEETVNLLEWLRTFLAARTAPAVPLGELAAPAESPADAVEVFSERADPASVDLHRRALALQQANPQMSYVTALVRAARDSE